MRNIKILGIGCSKCRQTEALVRSVVEEMGLDAQIEKIQDIQQILQYDILSTPAVVVDEEIKIAGRIPGMQELKAFFL